MTRFLVGLLLGALLGIAGTSAFLIVYGGADYLVSTSPRVRQLEATLSGADKDRDWLKSQLREATETTQRLESRFDALAARFERLGVDAGAPVPTATPSPKGARAAIDVPLPDESRDSASVHDEPAQARDDAAQHGSRTGSLDSIPTIAPAEQETPAP